MNRGKRLAASGLVNLFSILVQLLLLTGLSSCIILPYEYGHKELFNEERLAFISIGKTTKEEIANTMSDLGMAQEEDEIRRDLVPMKFRDGHWWLYGQVRKEAKWAYLMLVPYGGGDAGTIGDIDYRFLLIKFNNKDVVADYELSSSEGLGCNRQGVCVAKGSYTLNATVEDNDRAKQFTSNGDRCSLYLYGDQKNGERVWLDNEVKGSLLKKKDYFFLWQVEQGNHTLEVEGASMTGLNERYGGKSIEFQCAAGELYFVNVDRKRRGFSISTTEFGITMVDDAIGREEIGKRELLLTP